MAQTPTLVVQLFKLVLALPFLLFGYLVLVFAWSYVKQATYLREARKLGCGDVPLEKNKLPFSFDRLYEAYQSDVVKQFPMFMRQRFQDMGVKTFQFFGVNGEYGFFTYDPKIIQTILATKFNDFALGEQRRGNFFPLLGNGIFTMDGRGWEHSRAMLRPAFARDQVSNLELEEIHLQNLMKALPTDNQGWTGHIDLQTLFFRLTIDSATEFLFGKSVDSQLGELLGGSGKTLTQDEKDFPAAFDSSQLWLAQRHRLQGKYWLIDGREFRSSVKVCHRFTDRFVNEVLKSQNKEKSVDMEKGQNKYVFLEELARHTQDPIELRTQALNILLAGRDTTASLLGWLFYVLARDERVFNKLRATVLEHFGTFSEPQDISFSKLKACQYLQWCMNETLRIYAVVPINSRQAVRDTMLPRGGGPDGESPILVKKGQQVGYSVHAMHLAEEFWGKDAEQFKPERWQTARPQFSYLPFNGGPRICLGQQFALIEASFVAVRLMQRFDKIENLDTDPVTRYNLTLTMCSGNGVQARLHEAKE